MNMTIISLVVLYLAVSAARITLLYLFETLPNSLIALLLFLEGPAGWAVLLAEGISRYAKYRRNKNRNKKDAFDRAMEEYYGSMAN